MSIATTNAIYTAATGATALTALLGTGPGGVTAFFNARRLQTAAVYPQVTYRESDLVPVPGFFAGGGYVDREIYDFEVWVNDPGSTSIDAIRLQLDALFHNTTLSLVTPTKNFNYWCEREGGSRPDNYDPLTKSYFGLYRYGFITGQG